MGVVNKIAPNAAQEAAFRVPIYRKPVIKTVLQIPPEKRTYLHNIGALTYGQLFGVIVSAVSVGKMLFDFNFGREGGFINKYLIPGLGAISGLTLAINSTSAYTQTKANSKNDEKEAVPEDSYVETAPETSSVSESESDLSADIRIGSPRIRIAENLESVNGEEVTNDDLTLVESQGSFPHLKCFSEEADEQISEDMRFLDTVFNDLGFHINSHTDDDNAVALRYWLTYEYLKRSSKEENDVYNRAIKALENIAVDFDVMDIILQARDKKDIRLTQWGIVLSDKFLNLRTFSNVLGLPSYVGDDLIRTKAKYFFTLSNLLRPDQRGKIETEFVTKYLSQKSSALQ